MKQSLRDAIDRLSNLDRSLRPVPFADQREAALVAGLHALAAEYGRTIEFTRIDGNGEMNFHVTSHPGYGAELAAVISRVPRRMGIHATTTPMLPENNWCRINHFDVERLLNSLADA